LRSLRLGAALVSAAVLLTFSPSARASAAEPIPSTPAAASTPAMPPQPYVVAIDPGHGGSPTSDPNSLWDPGVVIGSVMEKNITLDLGLRLRKLLQSERVRVVMTRTTDQFVSITDRWNMAHAAGARLFVSLHANSFPDSRVSGITVFYPKPESLPFAEQLDASLHAALDPFHLKDDGVLPKPELWVRSDIPTVTVETAYLTNPNDFALLARTDFLQAVAEGVFRGILASDPQIEATRKAIESYEAEQARQAQAAAQAAAALLSRPSPWTGRLLLIGGLMVIALLLRANIRPAPPRARRARRRSRHTWNGKRTISPQSIPMVSGRNRTLS
jgi:N-acetylmuramoyl-L-alanine amidase